MTTFWPWRFIFIAILASGVGCDIFQTRVPENPGRSGATFRPPTEPDTALANLRNAVREKNTENYLRCLLGESFLDAAFFFEPTQSAQSTYGAVFSEWTRSSEEQYFRNLVAAAKPEGFSRLDFFEENLSRQGDSAVFTAKYLLVFQHDRPQLSDRAQGRLQFSLVRDARDSYWYIARWFDYPDTSQTTWSDFKGAFLN